MQHAGSLKETNEKGRKKEDRSYEQLRYDFILRNVYFDFIEILRTFGLKPYQTQNVQDICPQLPAILDVMCYKTNVNAEKIEKITPHFQNLTKSLGQPVYLVFPQKFLYRKDVRVSPLIPVTWALIFNIKANIESKYFSMKKLNVFKRGKILAGQKTNTLDNVLMSDLLEAPFDPTPLSCIYDLKPHRVAERVPLGISTFYVLVFQSRKIRDRELRVFTRERKLVMSIYADKMSRPVFKIPALEPSDKPTKTPSKAAPNTVILGKQELDASVLTMLQSVIDTIFNMEGVQTSLLTVDAEIDKFNEAKKLAKREKSLFKNIKFPESMGYEFLDSEDFQKNVLAHLELLQYGEFNNVFQAFRQIQGTPPIPKNFDYDDLRRALLMVKFESSQNVLVYETVKTKTLVKHFKKPKEFFPKPWGNDECFTVTVHQNWAEFIFDPIVNNKAAPETTAWCLSFVELLEIVGKSKKWQHNFADQTLDDESVADDKKNLFEFLIFSNDFLLDIGLLENNEEMDKYDGEESDGMSTASSRMSDGK